MAHAEIKEVLAVSTDKLFQAIIDYATYPQFVDGVSKVILKSNDPETKLGNAQVTYVVNLMKEVEYTLKHQADPKAWTMSWELVESAFMKKNSGRWTLKNLGPKSTEVHYEVEVEFSFPAPGFVVNRLIKGSLPTLLKNFEKKALST